MKHDYTIREHNIKAHVDIEVDIILKGDGQLTFTLRLNDGDIVDYALVEYIDVKKKYGDITRLIPEVRKKPSVPHSSRATSSGNGVRQHNIQHTDKGRQGKSR